MLGPKQEAQGALFYEFSIEDHVPQDHLLRAIDRFVNLSSIRQHLAPFYRNTGRLSVDPELLIRVLLVEYCLGIRSERRLCEEAHLNLAYRWVCHLDLQDDVPDHSTLSKNRHGRCRDSGLLRHLYESVAARCIAEGQVPGWSVFDATIFHCPEGRDWCLPLEHLPGGTVTDPVSDPYHNRTEDMAYCASGLPWEFDFVGNWDHLRSQSMDRFSRAGG